MSQVIMAGLHVFTPIALAIIINSIIFTSGWNEDSEKKNNDGDDLIGKYLPPGWVVGTVWVIILGLLGYGAWLIHDVIHLYIMFIVNIVFCLLYPFFTAGLQQGIGKVMNVVAFFLTMTLLFWVLGFARRWNVLLCITPLVVWVTYVNIVQLLSLRL